MDKLCSHIIKAKGFSLVELIIVIIIAGMIALSAIAYSSSLKTSLDLNSTGYKTSGDIFYTQSIAMTKNERHSITFTTNSYQISDSGGSPINIPAARSTTVSLGSNMTFTTRPTSNCIAFNGRGVPYNCSTGVPFVSDESLVINKDSEMVQIDISRETGYISVSML